MRIDLRLQPDFQQMKSRNQGASPVQPLELAGNLASPATNRSIMYKNVVKMGLPNNIL